MSKKPIGENSKIKMFENRWQIDGRKKKPNSKFQIYHMQNSFDQKLKNECKPKKKKIIPQPIE